MNESEIEMMEVDKEVYLKRIIKHLNVVMAGNTSLNRELIMENLNRAEKIEDSVDFYVDMENQLKENEDSE